MLLPLHMNLGFAPVIGGGASRAYVEIDGELIRVSGIEEAERLLRRVRHEEKVIETKKKRLRFITSRKSFVVQEEKQREIQKLETKIDEGFERIAALYELIQQQLDQQDDEAILLLI